MAGQQGNIACISNEKNESLQYILVSQDEKLQNRRKSMGTGKIVYEGICEVVNGKAVFMRQSLEDAQVFGMIAERLKEKEFREKLDGYFVSDRGDGYGRAYSEKNCQKGGCMLTVEGLEYLFDELFSEKIMHGLKETEDSAYRMYVLPMFMNGVKKNIDVTGFVIYGIICSRRCRQALWAEMPEGDDYYQYYEQSQYVGWALEECLKAEEIWDARLLAGLLEKMRKEKEGGSSYRLLMKIIYAGYGELRKWMEGKNAVTGSDIKAKVFTAHSGEYSMLHCISEMVLALVIAQDNETEICLDYEMLLLLCFMEKGEAEMRGGEEEDNSYQGEEADAAENHRKFLKKFREKYGTDSSLEALIFKKGTKRMDSVVLGVMAQYHISPRMFCGMDLTEEEVQKLLRLNDNWTAKSYWSVLVIAHLCKYIEDLKEKYLMHTAETAGLHSV